jgi:hypothetical protein
MNGDRRDISLTGIPKIGRATLIGMLVGWMVVALPVLIGMLALGASGEAFLFASHVGFFGGMGFGGMYGAVIQMDRVERGRASRVLVVPSEKTAAAERERVDHDHAA